MYIQKNKSYMKHLYDSFFCIRKIFFKLIRCGSVVDLFWVFLVLFDPSDRHRLLSWRFFYCICAYGITDGHHKTWYRVLQLFFRFPDRFLSIWRPKYLINGQKTSSKIIFPINFTVILSFLKSEWERTVNVILQTFIVYSINNLDRSRTFIVPDRFWDFLVLKRSQMSENAH